MEKVIAKHPALNRKQARFEQKTNQGQHGIGPDARTEPEQLICGKGGGLHGKGVQPAGERQVSSPQLRKTGEGS